MNPGNFPGHGFISPWLQPPPGLAQQISQQINPTRQFLVNPWGNVSSVFLHQPQFSQRFRPPLLDDSPPASPAPPLPPAVEYPPYPGQLASNRFVSELGRDVEYSQVPVSSTSVRFASEPEYSQVPVSSTSVRFVYESERDRQLRGQRSRNEFDSSQQNYVRRDDLWAAANQLQMNQENSFSLSQRLNPSQRKLPLLDDFSSDSGASLPAPVPSPQMAPVSYPQMAPAPVSYPQMAPPQPVPYPQMAPPLPAPQPVPPPPPRIETISISDLLFPPGRSLRPPKLLIIFRGAPGSGKTHLAKLIKEKEVELGGVAPRILSLDDYFMIENEREVKDAKTGRKWKEKFMEYEFDSGLENSYRKQMLKTFRKTVEDGFFHFILIDNINQKLSHFDEFWSVGKQAGFQVYVAEVKADLNICAKRNVHQRTEKEIQQMLSDWDETPAHYLRLNFTPLFEPEENIKEVEMEDSADYSATNYDPINYDPKNAETESNDDKKISSENSSRPDDESDQGTSTTIIRSKWENLDNEEKLDTLDGLTSKHIKQHLVKQTLDEFLQLPDDYENRNSERQNGKKRVRWADIEERKKMATEQRIGFVVGVSSWDRLSGNYDPTRALERTKYI